jgi:hypothetical protein
MPTFIDESGDTSDHPDAKTYYRLAAAWVPAQEADSLRLAIRCVRTRLGLPSSYEFKYHNTHGRPERRAAFYEAILAHGVRFAVACIDKRRCRVRADDRCEYFYRTALDLAGVLRPVYLAAEAACGKLLREPITVDSNEDALFLDCVRHAFRGIHSGVKPGVPLAQNPRFADSKVSDLLQVADMVCGAVGDMLDGCSDNYTIIAKAGMGVDGGAGAGVSYWG